MVLDGDVSYVVISGLNPASGGFSWAFAGFVEGH